VGFKFITLVPEVFLDFSSFREIKRREKSSKASGTLHISIEICRTAFEIACEIAQVDESALI